MRIVNELEHGLQPLKDEIIHGLGNDIPDEVGEVLDSVSVFVAEAPRKPHSTAFSFASFVGKRATGFVKDNIVASGVDLDLKTPLRRTFMSRWPSNELAPSVLNPTEHKVWGAQLGISGNVFAVLQMALHHDADEKTTVPAVNEYFNKRMPALTRLGGEAMAKMSRSGTTVERALRAHTPTTPNVAIINIDHVMSTRGIEINAPQLLEKVERVTDALLERLQHLGVELARNNGDGENAIIWLPIEIRNDPIAVQEFIDKSINPVLSELVTDFILIRAASMPGYVTFNKRNQATSRDFWVVDQKARNPKTAITHRGVTS